MILNYIRLYFDFLAYMSQMFFCFFSVVLVTLPLQNSKAYRKWVKMELNN